MMGFGWSWDLPGAVHCVYVFGEGEVGGMRSILSLHALTKADMACALQVATLFVWCGLTSTLPACLAMYFLAVMLGGFLSWCFFLFLYHCLDAHTG